ncbi:MAG: ABC transporter permease [Candidatus Obscuribacterales bacterium]
MSFSELVLIAWQGLISNKLRTGLTVLGIVIGIGSVITLLAVGKGAQVQAQKQIQSLGVNLITIRPGQASSGGIAMGGGSSATLTYDDALAIKNSVPAVADVAAVYNASYQIQYGPNNTNTQVTGTEPSHQDIRNFYAQRGRFFSDAEVQQAARVAVLGTTVVDNLFGREDPIGKTILIRGELFEVIGVMESKGAGAMGDTDDCIFVPLTTGYNTLFGLNTVTGRNVRQILVKAKSEEEVDSAQFQITNLLRLRHNIQPPLEDDFMLRTQQDIMQTADQVTQIFSLLLGATASISLLVGGIGIMNIMLVSVSERTREIGIRKAIGARYWHILMQFVLEATCLSLAGGVLGIIVGIAGSQAITSFANWTAVVSNESIVISFGVALCIGLFFGIYPANRAARLDPIIALRTD